MKLCNFVALCIAVKRQTLADKIIATIFHGIMNDNDDCDVVVDTSAAVTATRRLRAANVRRAVFQSDRLTQRLQDSCTRWLARWNGCWKRRPREMSCMPASLSMKKEGRERARDLSLALHDPKRCIFDVMRAHRTSFY